MRKKYRNHVKLVLSQLREAELQMNIRKCKFNVKETVFLESHCIRTRSSYEFKQSDSHSQLNHFDQSKRNSELHEIY